jgi:spermidine/putrescine transport system ATP-binding protein
MTMADRIAVMRAGKIEQLGSPENLYERPETAFVAGFLGVSNLLRGSVWGDDVVRLADGTDVRVPAEALRGRRGDVSVGIRPEKIRLDGEEANRLAGTVSERAYIGVATQYIADTASGPLTVYAQNSRPGSESLTPGEQVTLSWSPEATFVVEAKEEQE